MDCAERPGTETGVPPRADSAQHVIDQAQEALMAAHGCTARVASGILSTVSRSSGTPLRVVAETVMTAAERSSSGPPETIRAAITCALRNVLP